MRALRAFCAAAERSSFRLAADDLYLTASAVSHQIKQLEEALDVRLFARHPRSLELTDAGRAFADDVGPVLEELDLVIERHGGRSAPVELRLSVQPFFASELLVPRLSAFLAANPSISIKVDTSDDDTRGHNPSYDIAIRLYSSPPADESSERLFALQLVPVGSPAFYDTISVVAGRVTSKFPLVVQESRPKAWQKWQKSSGIKLPRNAPTIRLNSMISIARAAEEGLGAALLPAQLCSAWIGSGALVPLFDHELQSREAYYLTCNRNQADTDQVRTIRRWLLQEFAFDR